MRHTIVRIMLFLTFITPIAACSAVADATPATAAIAIANAAPAIAATSQPASDILRHKRITKHKRYDEQTLRNCMDYIHNNWPLTKECTDVKQHHGRSPMDRQYEMDIQRADGQLVTQVIQSSFEFRISQNGKPWPPRGFQGFGPR